MSRKTLQRKQDFKQETFPDGSFTVISGYSDSSKVYRVQKLSYEAAKEGTENQTLLLDKNGNWRNFNMTSCNVLPRLKEVRIGWKFGLYEYGKTSIFEDGHTTGVWVVEVLEDLGNFEGVSAS